MPFWHYSTVNLISKPTCTINCMCIHIHKWSLFADWAWITSSVLIRFLLNHHLTPNSESACRNLARVAWSL